MRETFEKQVCAFTIHDLSIGDLAIDDLAIDDLAVGCFGVHAIESFFRVRVATNFVKMMMKKKIAQNKSSNFDSSVQSPRALTPPRVAQTLAASSTVVSVPLLHMLLTTPQTFQLHKG